MQKILSRNSTMDIVETTGFIACYPNIEKCMYQYFDDTGSDRTKTAKAKWITEKSLDMLEEKNNEGCGIFFTVNGFDLEDRKQENVSIINAWVCEIDGMDKERQQKLIEVSPLKPSLIIESKNSYHLYWFAEKGTIEKRNDICNRLRNFFDGDPAIIDIARVLRMPGYYHCKNPNDKFLIQVIDYNEKKYTEQEMIQAFPEPITVSERKRNVKSSIRNMQNDDENFRQRVGAFDNKSMLEMLSGTQRVNGESIEFWKNSNGTEQIAVNGKSTGAWLDTKGMIGSSTGGGPTWIQWILWYGSVDRKDLYRFLIEKFPELKKQEGIGSKKDTSLKVIKSTAEKYNGLLFSTGNDEIDKHIGHMREREIMLLHGPSKNGKTSYTIGLANANGRKGIKTAFFSLEMTKKNLKMQQAIARTGLSRTQFESGDYTEQKRKSYEKVYNDFDKYFTIFDQESLPPKHRDDGYTLDLLISSIRDLHQEGYELFIIDSLSLIGGSKSMSTIQRQSHLIRELRQIKNSLPIGIVIIHHNHKGGGTFSGHQDLENFVDWRIEIKRYLDPDADNRFIFHQTKVRVFKERMGKELQFVYNYVRGELIYESHGYIEMD